MDYRPKEIGVDLKATERDAEYSDFQINELMYILQHGEKNAKTRAELCRELDMSDRKVRKLIEKARDEGCLILNNQNGKGYYLPLCIEDIQRQYKQDTNRALSILKRRKHMRKILKEENLTV